MSLIVKSGLPGNPLQWFAASTAQAVRVVAVLASQGRSFYFEPAPNGRACIAVDPEYAEVVKALIMLKGVS